MLQIAESLTSKQLDGMKVYLDCGTADRYGFAKPNEELHEMLTKSKIEHDWRLVEGGDHGWRTQYNQRAIPHSLEFVARALTASKGKAGLGGLLGSPGGKDESNDGGR